MSAVAGLPDRSWTWLTALLLVLAAMDSVAARSSSVDGITIPTSGHRRHGGGGATGIRPEPCKPDKLTVYKVILTTHWSRETFPKQYPEFRPHAQWSKVVGRSHDASYVLWRLGTEATEGVKIFSETGKSDVLDAQSQGEGGIYDEFSAPPVSAGVGRTEAEFFVDGNHSRVSLMSRIIPSPDWFIGIDGLNLCEQGSWVDSLTFEVDPVDAGTDNGFTFTAPNWATQPQEKIYRITSQYPSHPANSFFYAHQKTLPPLATFRFIKVKEYELSQVFYHDEDSEDEVAPQQPEPEAENDVSNVVHVLQPPQHHPSKSHSRQHHQPTTTSTTSTTTTTTTTTTTPAPPTARPRHHYPHHVIDPSRVTEPGVAKSNTGNSKEDVINSILETYEHKKVVKSNNKKGTKRRRGPRHCQVSEWSEWAPCSKTCGIGESTRERTVDKHPRRGGKACPPLLETKWCGSARACKGAIDHYFNW